MAPEIELAGNEVSFRWIVFETQLVESQIPFARTKKESFAVIMTVMDEPVPIKVLPVPYPHPPLNQFQFAPIPKLPPFTVKVVVVFLQTESVDAVILEAAVDAVPTLSRAIEV